MARPVLQATGKPGVLIGLNVDFDETPPTGLPSFSPPSGATWDNANWDQVPWGQGIQTLKDWQTVAGVGYAASLYLKISALDMTVAWVSTDYAMIDGAIL